MRIDLKDKRILHELDKNARSSYSEIAKIIKLSKNSVINRIKELEKEEIILEYNTLVNINSLGYTTYDVYIKFKNTDYNKEKEIIDLAIQNKDIWLVAKVEGNINLSLLISTKTPEEFDEKWNKFYEKIKPFVEISRIAILLEYHHFQRKYLLDKHIDKTTIIGKRENKYIDSTDEKILKILSKNARASLLEISQKLQLTTKTVAARIKRLEKEEIILGYKINLNFKKLGYLYYKIMLNLNDLSIKQKLYNHIRADKNTVYYDKFIGGTDFEFDLEVESFEKFTQFMDNLKKEFGTSINSYEYLNPTIIYKSQYF
jgi:Lrp/AsnC family transcriptional regulator, leucine-responsive regulatory protein